MNGDHIVNRGTLRFYQSNVIACRLILTKDNDDVIESLNPVCSTQGQKFFQCRLCTKTFRTKFAMRRHIDFHTGMLVGPA